jgi:hypothetical protein
MLDALLSFTKAVCKSCLRIRDRYTPALGRRVPAKATPSKQRIARRYLTSKKLCKYYKLNWLAATFSSMGEKDT